MSKLGIRLYQQQCVECSAAPLPKAEMFSLSPAELLLSLVYDLSSTTLENPVVWRTKGTNTLQIIFKNVTVDCDDFFARYQDLMAAVAEEHSLVLLGTTPNLETGELSANAVEGNIQLKKLNISGDDFYTLTNICIEITLLNTKQADFFQAALKHFDCHRQCIPLSKEFEPQIKESGIAENTPGAFFHYLVLDAAVSQADLLDSLSFSQKQQLWGSFLTEKASAAEFVWLLQEYEEGNSVALLEWELSLQSALEQAGMTVINHNKEFKVINKNGTTLYLDFLRSSAAERMFLKLLFPVVPKG